MVDTCVISNDIRSSERHLPLEPVTDQDCTHKNYNFDEEFEFIKFYHFLQTFKHAVIITNWREQLCNLS